MKEELKYEQRHQDITYKVLKYNPFDVMNDMYRYFIERLSLTEVERKLQWWFATFWVKSLQVSLLAQ